MRATALHGKRSKHRPGGVDRPGHSRYLCIIAAAIVCVLGSQASVALAGSLKRFDIEQQSLSTALNEFARQSDRQILFSTAVANAKRTHGIRGDLEPEDALRQLLKGTGLTFRVTSDNTILVESSHPGDTANVPTPQSSVRLAQVGREQSTSSASYTDQNSPEDSVQRA